MSVMLLQNYSLQQLDGEQIRWLILFDIIDIVTMANLFDNIKHARAQINKLKQQAQLLENQPQTDTTHLSITYKEYISNVIYSLAKADNNLDKSFKQQKDKLPLLIKKEEDPAPIYSYKKHKNSFRKNLMPIKKCEESTNIESPLAINSRPIKMRSHHQKHIRIEISSPPNIQAILDRSDITSRHSIQTAMMRKNIYHEPKSLKYVNLNQTKQPNHVQPPKSNLATNYHEAVDKYSKHEFMIINGVLVEEGPEYASFKRVYHSSYEQIRSHIAILEGMLRDKNVNYARLDGKKIAYLSLKSNITKLDLLGCLVEGEQIKDKIFPKKKFEGKEGVKNAADVIKSIWKMSKEKHKFKLMREKAIIIQRFFKKKYNKLKLEQAIADRNIQIAARFEERQDQLRRSWNHLKNTKRIEIHVNSLQVDEQKRLTMENLMERENIQLSRIFKLKDENLVIIYISANPLPTQLINYYYRMLELAQITKYKDRLIFINPENVDHFPNHLSLGKLLYYSSKTLKQLKMITLQIPTIIVPGSPSNELIKICDFLSCYLYAAQPQKIKQISTKSQFRRFCSNLRIQMLPGTMEMYDYMEFLNTFSVLIIKNPEVQTWILKIDDEFNGRGISYFEISKSKYIQSILRRVASEDNTNQVFATDVPLSDPNTQQITIQLRDYLKQTLSNKLQLATPKVYRNYAQFMGRFIKKGGVIEAAPPCLKQHLKYPSVSFNVQPNGQFSIITTYQKIIGQPFRSVGCSFPQTCLDYDYVVKIIREMCQSFKLRKIFGYFTIDFVFYEKDKIKKSWVIDIEPYLNNYTAGFYLFDVLMKGYFLPQKNLYIIEQSSKSDSKSIDTNYSLNKDIQSRQYIYLPYFSNPNLLSVRIKQFFKQARIEGYNFDIGNHEGLCVMLVDQLTTGVMGLLSVSQTKQENIERLRQMLQFIGRISEVKNVNYGQNENYTSTDAIMIKDVVSVFTSLSRRDQKRNAKEKAIKKYQNNCDLQFII